MESALLKYWLLAAAVEVVVPHGQEVAVQVAWFT
jgi:hypothetical protein